MDNDKIMAVLQHFKAKKQQEYGLRRIGIFGSVARGTSSSESDIDVVVELMKQDLFQMIGLKQDLEESLHARIDIVSYRENMNPALRKRIDRDAIYV